MLVFPFKKYNIQFLEFLMSLRQDQKEKMMLDITAPSPSEWGPHLWKMLHWLAERSGKQKVRLLQDDELFAWTQLLKLLTKTLPCALCKGHYTAYIKTHFDFDILKSTPPLLEDKRRELLRRWIWELHEDVNRRRECIANIVPYESLESIYGVATTIKFSEEREHFYEILLRAQRQKIVERDDVMSLKRIISSLYGIYR